jgi:hypothetical protein
MLYWRAARDGQFPPAASGEPGHTFLLDIHYGAHPGVDTALEPVSVYDGIYFDDALASSARAPASMPAKPMLPSWQAYS